MSFLFVFCVLLLLLVGWTDCSIVRKRKANEIEGDELSFLLITSTDISRLPLHSKPSFHFDTASEAGVSVTLLVDSDFELRINTLNTTKKKNADDDLNSTDSEEQEEQKEQEEELEKESMMVKAWYCNVHSLSCKSLMSTSYKVEPGNLVLLTNRRIKQASLDSLLHGIRIGALHRHNIQAVFRLLFCCADIRMLLVEDFPEPMTLNLPDIPVESYKESKATSIWSSWPLLPYGQDAVKHQLEEFEAAEDKDMMLLKMGKSGLDCLPPKYLQLGRFTELCRQLDYPKPWSLYSALQTNTFIPEEGGEKKSENLVVALFLIELDAENVRQLVNDFESIQRVADAQADEEKRAAALTRLSLMHLMLFGVQKDALLAALQKYPPGLLFLQPTSSNSDSDEPAQFMRHVDTYDFLELTTYDFPLLLSLLRHFLVNPPSAQIYLRTLLWMVRTDSRCVPLGTVDLIRGDVEDEACLRTWELALAYCPVQVRRRFASKKRAPMKLFQ